MAAHDQQRPSALQPVRRDAQRRIDGIASSYNPISTHTSSVQHASPRLLRTADLYEPNLISMQREEAGGKRTYVQVEPRSRLRLPIPVIRACPRLGPYDRHRKT